MTTQTKKCPMCAEQIPLETTICEYCGAHFEVTSTGYCQNCHQIREADEHGCCKVCNNAITDQRMESRLIEEPGAQPLQSVESATPGARSIQKDRRRIGALIAIGIVGLIAIGILAVIGLLFVYGPRLNSAFAQSTFTPTAVETESLTVTPMPSATNTPEPAPLASDIVIPPIEEMANDIPWLPLDANVVPGTIWVGFNLNETPFDNPLVREALAAALDRQALTLIAEDHGMKNVRPATSFTPPETLGRVLYGQIGIPFNPDRAKILLARAGYAAGENFPEVTMYTNTDEVYVPLFEEITRMWKEHLNINLTLKFFDTRDEYVQILYSNPPSVFRQGWTADSNDPDNFLRVFHSGADYNIPGFSNSSFDQLIDQAAQITEPAKRQELYIQAERILCEQEIPIIPLFHFASGE